ncbi:Pumilio-like protein 12 [Dichanthelium oligosanthes]|uniref:Pumilio-like protein 12 n=1 Tax=Dichanthelium oligosanthes TaxID=888268 RepID=A0A1E5UJD3_9POAL|nr:Pumilio-like protein 12 [Dichanthelium oligosanthes]
MDEVQSNQDNPELWPFLGSITGAMFANHGEQSAGCSSPEAGWVPSSVALHDMAMVGSNRHGVGIVDNAKLFDDRSLTAAFENMNLSLTDATADSAANSGSVASTYGHCPAGLAISSADNMTNAPRQPAFAQESFVPSSLMINNAEHMKPRFRGQNLPLSTGMHCPDNAYVSGINLPPASPFQQQHFIDRWPQTYVPYQQRDSKFRHHDIDVKRHFLMQPQYSYHHMPPVSDVHWINSNQYGVVNSSSKSATSPHLRAPDVYHLGHTSPDIYWNGPMVPNGNNCPSLIYPDCLCETCEYCQNQLSEKLKHPYRLRRSHKGSFQNHTLDKVKLKGSPEKILMKSEDTNSSRNIKPGFAFDGCAETNQRIDCNRYNHHLNIQNNDSLCFDMQSSQCLPSVGSECAMNSAQHNYNSMDEVVGELYLLAKDQNGCRFLQRIFTEGSQEDAQKVFDGVIEQIDELMVDPFGNYLVQKLLELCNDDQKMHILYEITKIPGQLIKVACNMHGTRVVQKVIETISTSDEASMVVSALSPGVITLMMDANGSHVAHRCLQKLSPEYKAFLLDAATEYCVELAKDRQGCCIIQKCIIHAKKEQKNRLLYNITSRTLDLAEHQYGNYVIQYILELKVSWATDEILDKLEGHYGYLSMQKCSSNVVEKCLKEAQEPKRTKIIHELINDPKLPHILIDQFGNYVIQTAFRECEDATVEAALIKAIKPHVGALRNNMFGKRILSKTCLKNRKF